MSKDTRAPQRAGVVELVGFGLAFVVAVLLVVALVIRLHDAGASKEPSGARNRAMSAGASGAAALLSYDYRTIDGLAATNRQLLTSGCATGYAAQVGGVQTEVTKNKVVLAATVRAVAVESIDGNSATVLVVVDEKRTGSDRAGEQSSQLAVSVGLVKDGGRWLVDDLVPAGTAPAGTSSTAQRCS